MHNIAYQCGIEPHVICHALGSFNQTPVLRLPLPPIYQSQSLLNRDLSTHQNCFHALIADIRHIATWLPPGDGHRRSAHAQSTTALVGNCSTMVIKAYYATCTEDNLMTSSAYSCSLESAAKTKHLIQFLCGNDVPLSCNTNANHPQFWCQQLLVSNPNSLQP